MATAFAPTMHDRELDDALNRVAVNAIGTLESREDRIRLREELKQVAQRLGHSVDAVMPLIQGKIAEVGRGLVTDLDGNIVHPDKDTRERGINDGFAATLPLERINGLPADQRGRVVALRAQHEQQAIAAKLAAVAAPIVMNLGLSRYANNLMAPDLSAHFGPDIDTSNHVKTTFDRIDLKTDNANFSLSPNAQNSMLLNGGMNYAQQPQMGMMFRPSALTLDC